MTRNFYIKTISIILMMMLPTMSYALNPQQAAVLDAIGKTMQQSGNQDNQVAGQEISQEVDKVQNSQNCDSQCLSDLKTRISPGHTMRCKDDAECRQCLSTCNQ